MSSEEQFKNLKCHPSLPSHIGIIMDGNGRWAKKRGLPRVAGHSEGVHSVQSVVETCGQLGIGYLTIYTFSEENWQRPNWEVAALMQLLVRTIDKQIDQLKAQNVKIKTIGHLEKLPDNAAKKMLTAIEDTQNNTGLTLNVALSYGGRQEIIRAVKKVAQQIKNGEIQPDEISFDAISENLYTAGQPDPDLIIRTGGENRISNFLLWQLAYSEIFITETAWPDFKRKQLLEAVWDFVHRERRFGKVSEQLRPNISLQNA